MAAVVPDLVQADTLINMFRQRVVRDGPTVAVQAFRDDAWQEITWSQLAEDVAGFASGLLDLVCTVR